MYVSLKFIGTGKWSAFVEEVMEEISWYPSIYKDGSGIRWGITLKDCGAVIGSCGFLHQNSKHSKAEIGFELSKEYWEKA